ncbi:MAG: tape measure protein [Anaerolineae bacterium]
MAIKAAQLLVEVKADTAHAERGMRQVQQQARGLGAGLGGIAKLAGGAVAALGGIAVAKRLFSAAKSAVVDFNASLEQSEIAWATMLGSERAARRMMSNLQQFAKETPFEFAELEEASRRLLAMGFSAQEILPTMTSLGDAAAALGLGTEGVNRLGLALGQMRAKTKVSAEEMRQLTEAGVPAWEILAQAVGKPIPEVMKLASAGKIAATTFINAFETFSQQNYGGMMERQSQTFKGAMSNIKDSLTQAAATAFQPLFAKLSEGAQRIASFLNTEQFDRFVARTRGLVSGAVALVGNLSERWHFFWGRIQGSTSEVTDAVQERVYTLVGWVSENLPVMQEIVGEVVNRIRGLWEEHGERIVTSVRGVWGTLQEQMRTSLAILGEVLGVFLSALKGDWEDVWERCKTIVVLAWNSMVEYLGTSARSVLQIIGSVLQALGVEDPTERWMGKIDQWVDRVKASTAEALGVADRVKQVTDETERLADAGRKIHEKANQGLRNLEREASKGVGGLREVESAALAAARGAEVAAQSFDTMGSSAGNASANLSDMTAALVRAHPASVAMAQAVAGREAQIAGINAALQANQRRQREMQEALSRTQARIGELNTQLNEAQRRLVELANPRLVGMTGLDRQIQAVQDHLKRVELAELLGRPLAEIVRQYPLLTAGAEEYIRRLEPGEQALRDQLRALQLMQSLQFDERLRLLQQAAAEEISETTYEAALEAIVATKQEISDLSAALAQQEARALRQEAALAKVRAEAERLNDALQGYQAQLQAAQQAQTLVNQGLELAYSWFLQDRQAMLELGGEAAAQVAIMDGKARELLGGVSAFASDTTTIASETLAGMIATFESSSAEAVIAVNLELAKIPRDIYTYHHIVRVYDGGSSGPSPTQPTPIQGRASGGPVYAGQAYIVGEEGPELFVPRLTGSIVPGGGTGRGSAGAGGIVIERLVVEGTVISERELAAALYDELQRLRRRNSAARLS